MGEVEGFGQGDGCRYSGESSSWVMNGQRNMKVRSTLLRPGWRPLLLLLLQRW